METYFTIEEVAKYLNYAEKTIRKWVLNREIPYIKIHQTIRFRLSEIEVWVEKNRVRTLSDVSGTKTSSNGSEDSGDGSFNETETEAAKTGGGQ